MKINIGKLIKVLLIATICLALFAPTVMAAEVQSNGIPVRISLGGSPPELEEDYEIVMSADDIAYPMPVGSVDGVFTLNIPGENLGELPGIKFSSLGIYTYTISQKAGTNKLASYDDSVYNLVIYVTNAETGEGFETTVLLYKTGNTNKFEEADFYNEYEEIVIIEDEDPPLGPVIIEDEETPIGPAKLPKTGEVSSELFLLIGAIVVTTGVVLKKKNA